MLPRLFQKQRERGVAIIMSLSVLSLVLLLAMGYAYSSQSSLQLSSVNNDLSRASLLAEAGVQRCIGFLKYHFEDVAPHRQFLESGGRRFLVSYNDSTDIDATEGAAEALSVAYPLGSFLDSTDFGSDPPGWVYITPTVDTSKDGDFTDTSQIATGRFAYVIINETGKVDPTHLIDSSAADGWVAEGFEGARAGGSLDELSLSNLLDSIVLGHSFHDRRNASTDAVVAGMMPESTGWLSIAHIFRSHPNLSTAIAEDSVANSIFPWTREDDRSKYWDDIDGDGIVSSDTELFDTLNVSHIAATSDPSVSHIDLYDFLVRDVDRTDAEEWRTHRDEFSSWLRLRGGSSSALYTDRDLRRLAAQTALNIADAADTDNSPRVAYISTASPGFPLVNSTPSAYDLRLIGDEGQHMIGDVMLTLEIGRSAAGTEFTFTPKVQASMFNKISDAPYTGNLKVSFKYTFDTVIVTPTVPPTVVKIEVEEEDEITISSSDWTHKVIVAPDTASWASMDAPIAGSTVTSAPVPNVPSIPGVISLTLVEAKAIDGTLIDAIPARKKSIDSIGGVGDFSAGTKFVGYTKLHPFNPYHNGWDTSSAPPEAKLPFFMEFSRGVVAVADVPEFPTSEDSRWLESNSVYSGRIFPRNSTFTRVSQLGRVPIGYGYHVSTSAYKDAPDSTARIGGTLQFWTHDEEDIGSSDGDLLDMFTDSAPINTGLINANSPYFNVWQELFAASAASPKIASSTVLAASADSILTGVGDLTRLIGLVDSGVSSAYNDETAEENLATFDRFLSFRHNYFTIIVVAQTLEDTGEAAVGEVKWRGGPSPGFARVKAEQKVLATIVRDVIDGSYKVLRMEHLSDE